MRYIDLTNTYSYVKHNYSAKNYVINDNIITSHNDLNSLIIISYHWINDDRRAIPWTYFNINMDTTLMNTKINMG